MNKSDKETNMLMFPKDTFPSEYVFRIIFKTIIKVVFKLKKSIKFIKLT